MSLSKNAFYLLFLLVSTYMTCMNSAHSVEGWKPRSEGVQMLGQTDSEAYRFTSGYLDNNNANFQNGIIEFELKSSPERSFFYVYFRKQSAAESEVVYIRNHKSNAPDTIQYSPVYQGRSAWQLYHGESGTASATLPDKSWVKVKLEIMHSRLSMWIGDNPEPNIKDMALTGSNKAGGVSFRGFIPRGSAAKQTAVIRNITIQHATPLDSVAEKTEQSKPGFISNFKVSPAFAVTSKFSPVIPQKMVAQDWQPLTTDSHGKLELLRHRKIPQGARAWAVAADAILNAKRPTACRLNVGFSDAITLELNGKTQLFLDASYRYSDRRQQGLMHASQASVFLNLNEGDNMIRAIVSDSFGGWGLQAQMIDCEGVSVVLP